MSLRQLTLAAAALAGVFGAALPASTAFAREAAVYTSRAEALAVSGYDPVAYFTVGAPTKGSADFTTVHEGATYRFVSAANRDTFIADPGKYTPQFGGYCAWAVSEGYVSRGNPQYWRVVDGKLYLNFDGGVQRRWLRDVPGNITKADGNWPAALETYRGPR